MPWKRYCLAVVGEETHMVVPLSFHTHWTKAGASMTVARLNAKRDGHTTYFAVWDRRKGRLADAQ
jgi:hypothetical protein